MKISICVALISIAILGSNSSAAPLTDSDLRTLERQFGSQAFLFIARFFDVFGLKHYGSTLFVIKRLIGELWDNVRVTQLSLLLAQLAIWHLEGHH